MVHFKVVVFPPRPLQTFVGLTVWDIGIAHNSLTVRGPKVKQRWSPGGPTLLRN